MVAIVSGNGLGLFNSSLNLLGGYGPNGQSTLGRSGERLYLNAASGNLVIQNQDEYLANTGLDLALIRTYNSQGLFTDDNGDNWRLNVAALTGLPGSPNTAGSTVTKRFGDGAEILYTYDMAQGLYISPDGDSAHDTLSFNAGVWTWTDGSLRNTETYNSSGQLTTALDVDGNTLSYFYTGGLLTRIEVSGQPRVFFDYAGNNLTQIRTLSQGQEQITVRYAYDGLNRLSQVIVDVTPADNSVADGRTYVTSYTYDGASTRVASITQGDGTTVSFTYSEITGEWRLASYTDGEGNVTQLTYNEVTETVQHTAMADPDALKDTESMTQALNTTALSTTAAGWAGVAQVPADGAQHLLVDANGNALLTWFRYDPTTGESRLYANRYDAALGWQVPEPIAPANAAWDAQFVLDAAGNAMALWTQYDPTTAQYTLYARRYDAALGWQPPAPIAVAGYILDTRFALDAAGNALAVWTQYDATTAQYTLYAGRYDAALGWQPPAPITAADSVWDTRFALDAAGNAMALWMQYDLTTSQYTLYAGRYAAALGWQPPEPLAAGSYISDNRFALDAAGNAMAVWTQYDLTTSQYTLYARRYDAVLGWQTPEPIAAADYIWDTQFALDAAGNALALWTQYDPITFQSVLYVSRYDAALGWQGSEPLSGAGSAQQPRLVLDETGNALALWTQYDPATFQYTLYTRRYDLTLGWQGAQPISATDNIWGAEITMDATGHAIAVWSQYDAATSQTQSYSNYFDPEGGWQGPAQHGVNAMDVRVGMDTRGRALVVWSQYDSVAGTYGLYADRYTPAESYYLVQAGDTWASVATVLYGSAAFADELQAALGNPPLAALDRLIGLPGSLTDTHAIPPYYTVQAQDTWSAIAQAVYGDARAADALQAALGNPLLTAGVHLTIPPTLSYTVTRVAGQQSHVTGPLGQITTYTTDAQGQLLEVQAPAVNGARSSTRYAYDAQGNVISIIDPNGNTLRFTYDDRGNRRTQQDSLGNTITYTYSASNQLLTETVYLSPDPDGAGAGQPSNPLTTRYVYDAEDHLRFSVTPEGRVGEYRYNAQGERIATVHYTEGRYDTSALTPVDNLSEGELSAWVGLQDVTRIERTDYAYDFRGQLSTTTTYSTVDNLGNGLLDGTQAITRYIYDQGGRLLQTIDPRGELTPDDAGDYVTTYTYDGLGRLLTTNQWIDATHTRTTLTSYDDLNRRTATTFENGLITTQVYDTRGALISQIQSDSTGPLGTTTYQYDAAGRLRSTTDPTGLKNHVLYDESGRVVASIDATGSLTESIYDLAGNLVKTIGYATRLNATQLSTLNTLTAQGHAADVALGSIRPESSADDRTGYMLYDRASRPVLAITAHDTDPSLGFVTQTFYDGAGRLTDVVRYATAINTSTLPASPIPDDVVITPDATNDRHSRTFYDRDGNPIGSLDAEGYLTEYRYAANGALSHTIRYAFATTANLRTNGDFTALKSSITNQGPNPNDQHAYAFYDSKGQLIATLDAENYLTEYQYDLAGNRTQELRYYARANNYTGSQTVLQLRPSNQSARLTVTQYNGANQVTQVTTLPDNTVNTFTYDEVGQLVSTTRAYGTNEARTTQARYDLKGRITQELTGEGSAALAALVTPTPGQIDAIWTNHGMTHTYDAAGRRTSTTDANGRKTLFYYDNANRLSTTINALGEVSQSVYNAFGEVIDTRRYTNRLSATDLTGLTGGLIPANLATTLAAIAAPTGVNADAHSRINYTLRGAIREILAAPDNAALTSATGYTYNAFGELLTQDSAKDASTRVLSSYAYDKRGLRTDSYEDTASLSRHTSVQYDAFGRVTQSTDGNGIVRTAAYDKLGRTVTSTNAFGTSVQSSTSQTYDAFGRILTAIDARGNQTSFTYADSVTGATGHHRFTVTTAEGISTVTETNAHGEIVAITDGNNHTVTYTYNKNGNLTGSTDALNHGTQLVYDNAGLQRLSIDANGHVTQYLYDAANRLITRIVDPNNYTDANGNTVSNTDGLNLTTQYSYDGQGRTLTSTNGNGIVTQTQYDAKGQVTAVTVDPTGLNITTGFSYDAQGRTLTVTEAQGRPEARTTQYVYDNLGRRTQQIQDAVTGGLNIVTAYSYDANNNVIATVEAQGTPEARTTRYAYDAKNRLVYTIDTLGDVTERVYDANGNVIAGLQYGNALNSVTLAAVSSNPSLAQATIKAAITANPGVDRGELRIYDQDNRQRFSVDSLGYVKETAYTGTGQVNDSIVYATGLNTSTVLTAAGIDPSGMSADQIRAALTTVTLTPDLIRLGLDNSDSNNQITSYTYDRAGRLESTTDADLKTEYYGYDNVGNKTSFTNKIGITAGNPAYTWHYEYDAANRLIEERTPIVAVTRLSTNADGSLAVNADGSAIPVTSDEAIITRMTYDGVGNVKTRTEGIGLRSDQTENLENARTTTYGYDALGRQTQVMFPEVAVYNAAANNQTNTGLVISQSANVMSNAWTRDEATNTLVATTGVSITLDPSLYTDSTPTSITAKVYKSDGTLVGSTTTDIGTYSTVTSGKLVNYQWNLAPNWNGKVNISTTALATDTYRVELEVRDDAVASPSGAVGTSYYYDGDGTWVRTGTMFVNVGSQNATLQRSETNTILTTTTQYDALGNATVNRDGSGNYSYKVYDSLGRVQYELDAKHFATEYSYDAFGNKKTITRHANALVFENHPQAFTLTDVQSMLVASPQSPQNRTLTNVYDALGRVTDIIEPAVFNYDSTTGQSYTQSPTTHSEYNAFGQIVKLSTLNNPITNSWVDTYYYYDTRGQRVAQVDALGYLTSYQYDAMGNFTQQVEYATALSGNWNTTTQPTAVLTSIPLILVDGQWVPDPAASNQNGFDRTTRYTYDTLNRKTAEIRVGIQYSVANNTFNASATTAMVGNSSTSYGYDAVGNLVSVKDNSGATTITSYDVLGRATSVAEPERQLDSGTGIQMSPTLTIQDTSLTSSFTSVHGSYNLSDKWHITLKESITVNLPYTGNWGDGQVTVAVDVTLSDGSKSTRTFSPSSPTDLTAFKSWSYDHFEWVPLPPSITSLDRIRVSKVVDGKTVLLCDQSAAPTTASKAVFVRKPAISNSVAALKYKAVGGGTAPSDWLPIPATALQDRGDYWAVDISALAAGNYDYQLSYAEPLDPVNPNNPTPVYYTGTGSFTVNDTTTTSSLVDTRATTSSASSNASGAWYDDGYGPYYLWSGSNTINLGWNSLAEWGSGDVRVTVNYVASNGYDQTTPASQTQTLRASAGITGATFSWAAGGNDPYSYQHLNTVSSFQVSKYINGAWVQVYNQPVSGTHPYRLVLKGNTTGVTAISIDGQTGTFAAPVVVIGSGARAVDLPALARGIYTYHLIRNGVTETTAHTFTVETGNLAGGTAVVQEIYGYKDASGFARRLEIANLPADTASVTLEYRRAGDTSGPYLSKTSTTSVGGVFTLNYDEIANGNYEYKLTARNAAGGTVAIASGATGVLAVKRGAQSITNQQSATKVDVKPLTKFERDIFGNVVHQWLTAEGAVSAQDPHSYTQYNSFGSVRQAIDAEGKTTFYSYNAAGSVAKEWQLQTNADGVGRYAVTLYDYDALNTLKTTTVVVDAATSIRTQVEYDAFGSIVNKGTNDGWQEMYEYDNAGRLWRSNQGDGVAKVYLYNLAGNVTAEIRSQNRDLADNLLYTNAKSVADLTNDVQRNNTIYDKLGRVTGQVQPSWTKDANAGIETPTLTIQDLGLTSSASGFWTVHNANYTVYHTRNTVNLAWPGLANWGGDQITVTIDYTKTDGGTASRTVNLDAASTLYGATIYWEDVTVNFLIYPISYLNRVRVSKVIDGKTVMLYDQQPGAVTPTRTLLWKKPAIGNSVATLQYKPVGGGTDPSDWLSIPAAALLDRGDYWAVDIGALAAGNYDYQLSYAEPIDPANPGATTPVYYTGLGVFTVPASDAPFVAAPKATASASSTVNYVVTGFDESGNPVGYWDGANYITANWSSLADWGTGDVRVTANFTYTSGSASSITQTFSGASAVVGATLSWGDSSVIGAVTGYTVSKNVNGIWVTVYNQSGVTGTMPSRLILTGASNANVTGIAIEGQAGPFNASELAAGSGVRGVNLNLLPRGTYTYYLIRNGVTETTARTLLIETGNLAGGSAVVQEIYGFKGASTFTRQIEIANLPTGTTSVLFEYRRAGDTGPYLGKTSTTSVGGVFTLNYDEIANGNYEYKLTARNAAGGTVAIASGATGVLAVKRGGASFATSADHITITPVITQTVDRWGNVLSVTDPRDATLVTRYIYNTNNQIIKEVKPMVEVVDENGLSTNQTPTTRYVYDDLGRQIATTDANNYTNGLRYDMAGQLVRALHADGSYSQILYDSYGRKAGMVDANGNKTVFSYDRNDRLVKSTNALLQSEQYQYDELGNRIAVTSGISNTSAGDTTHYFYDVRGYVIKSRLAGGQEAYSAYDLWGHKIQDRHSGTTDTSSWTYDYFGKLTAHTDLGGVSYTYDYNKTNQLVKQTNGRGQNLAYSYYENGQLKRIVDRGVAIDTTLQSSTSETWYDYDAAGHRTREVYLALDASTHGMTTYQDVHTAYDNLGRVSTFNDIRAQIAYSYDAADNRRHTLATYQDNAGAPKTQNYWYLYDAMNRITLSQGVLQNGLIQISSNNGSVAGSNTPQGIELAYDGANNRRTVTYYDSAGNRITEYYSYDEANRLLNTYRDEDQQDPAYPDDPTKKILVRSYTSERSYDASGRVSQYVTYGAPGVKSGSQTNVYNSNGWLSTQSNFNGAGTLTATIDFSAADAYDPYGNPLVYYVRTPNLTNTYSTTYRAFEAKREQTVNGGSTYFQSGQTSFSYDVNGNLVKVTDITDASHTRSFLNNSQGQILQKNDYQNKHQYYFYANGQPIGSKGDLTDADFDYNYTPVSDSYPATTPSSYVVNAGDTLQSVALAVFGDAKLWYLIADANGLNAGGTLTAGQKLKIPNKITNLFNDASSFSVYNAGMIIGSATPATLDPPPPPPPQKIRNRARTHLFYASLIIPGPGHLEAAVWHNSKEYSWDTAKAGREFIAEVHNVIGDHAKAQWLRDKASNNQVRNTAIIFSIVIAIVIAVCTWGSLTWLGAMIVAAMTSIMSQTILVGSGVQQSYNWKQVAISALTAGITKGLQVDKFGTVGNAVANSAINNVASQGLNIMLGQQDKFSWAGLVVSAAVAGVAAGFSGPSAGETASRTGSQMFTDVVKQIGGRLFSTFVVPRYTGKSEWARVALDSFGNYLANSVVDAVVEGGRTKPVSVADPYFMDAESATAYPLAENQPIMGTSVASMHDGLMGSDDPINSGVESNKDSDVPSGMILPPGARTPEAEQRLAIQREQNTRMDLRRNTAQMLGYTFLGTDIYGTDPYDDIANASSYGLTPKGLGETASPFDYVAGPFVKGAGIAAAGIFRQSAEEIGGALVANSTLRTGPYGSLVDELKGTGLQANHLNQNAAFRTIIPSDEGIAVGMRGNAFTEVGSPHYNFHSELESFWGQYRKGGESFGSLPMNAQYGEAVTNALRSSGLSSSEAARLSAQAAQNRAAFGLLENQPVPTIPGRLPQAKP